MPNSVSRWSRVARGFGAAAVSIVIAATAHGLAGGGFATPIALGFTILFGGLACMLLAGRPLGRIRLAVIVVTAQLLFHGLFTLFGSAAGSARIVETHGGHHDSYVFLGGTTDSPASADMSLMHLLAATTSYAVIRHGMRVLARLASLAAMMIAPLRRAAAALLARPAPARRGPSVASLTWRPTTIRFLSSSIERGPPVTLAH